MLESSKHPSWRSYGVQGAGAVVLWIVLCFFLIPSHAAGKLEDQNKAVPYRFSQCEVLKKREQHDKSYRHGKERRRAPHHKANNQRHQHNRSGYAFPDHI